MADALGMARLAVASGTDTLVATPHRAYQTRRTAPPDWLRALVRELQSMLDREGVALRVLPGLEIPIGPHVAEELAAGTLLTIGDAGRFALLEPPFERLPADGLQNIQRVLDAGFGVVLAHPERNALVQRDLTFVEACADVGVTFQLTTGSLLGWFGPRAQRTAEAILAHAAEWPLVFASDTHDQTARPPTLMPQARDAAALLVGEAAAQEMVDARPRALLAPRAQEALPPFCPLQSLAIEGQ